LAARAHATLAATITDKTQQLPRPTLLTRPRSFTDADRRSPYVARAGQYAPVLYRERRWNLNVHYHRVVLDAVPASASTALDIGAGDGLLTFDLADSGLSVSGIDTDAQSVQRAAASSKTDRRCLHPGSLVLGDLDGRTRAATEGPAPPGRAPAR
jgi:SAM-dependent methyltransferase